MMQRPRNRQGRGGASQQNPSQGRGRGRPGRQFPTGRARTEGSQNVPNVAQVIPGASVSIILKIDQPTGREVQGVVQDLLTSGNHPRGIKVRLVDGRVGRVQRMVSEEEARTASEGLSELGRNGEGAGQSRGGLGVGTAGRRSGRYRDVREEEEMDAPRGEYSLEDFLPVDHPLREEGSDRGQATDEAEGEEKLDGAGATQVCPVCGEFEGDEAALSHHVNAHFDDTSKERGNEFVYDKQSDL